MKGDKWAQDKRLTIKSCAVVIIIGVIAAATMLTIRLVGERRLQRFLDMIFNLKRNQKVEKLTTKRFVPDNQS